MLAELENNLKGFIRRSEQRTSQTGRPSDLIYSDDDLQTLVDQLAQLPADVAEDLHRAHKAMLDVRQKAYKLRQALESGDDETLSRAAYEEANGSAVATFRECRRRVNEAAEEVKREMGIISK